MATSQNLVQPSGAEGGHLLDYIRVLLKRLWLIVGIFVVVVGVVAFATWRATPMYRSRAVINIQQPRIPVSSRELDSLVGGYANSFRYYQTQFQLLRQKATVLEMVEREKLASWQEYAGKSKADIANEIVGQIEVSPRKNTTLVDVGIVGASRDLVHKVCNALVETYADLQARQAKSSIEETLNTLESRYTQYQAKANTIAGEEARLLERHNTDQETFLVNFEFQQKQLMRLHGQLEEKQFKQLQNRALYEEIAAAVAQEGGEGLQTLHRHPILQANRRITEMETASLMKEQAIRELEREFGPQHPRILDLQRDLKNAETLRMREKDQVLLGIKRDYEEAQKTVEFFAEQVQRYKEDFRANSAVKREYDELKQDKSKYLAEAGRYSEVWDKLQMNRNDDFKPVTVVQRAEQPLEPFSPNKKSNLIMGMVFGLLGGIGLAFFLEYMDDTVKTKEELGKITSVPLFGVIPNISVKKGELSKRDLYAYSQPKSTVSEAFRGIRTAISYSSQKQENRVYLVTSAGPQEGKTTIVINVATVMAYSGTRTLLVDADLRKPRVHKSFGLENSKGLTNLIIGEAKVEDVVQHTSVEGLDVLTSGPIPPNPSELLGRDRMLEILELLRSRYDRILIDTPPIGAVTDAAVLGRIVDSVILVVHAGRTRRKLIERGLEQLNQIDVDVSGIVLNNLRIGRKRYYPGYYHYYYYYSSYYGSSGRDAKKKDKTPAAKS